MLSGYHHPLYASSLVHWGRPFELPRSGAWLMERTIDGDPRCDASGPYPVLSCVDWTKLERDLEDLGQRVVTLTAVPDPCAGIDPATLARIFPALCRPFKTHHVLETERLARTSPTKHHRYYARRALERLSIDVIEDTPSFLDEWHALYGNLIQRHAIRGIQAFPRGSLRLQLEVPGLVIFRAKEGSATVAAHLWYLQGEVAVSHLAAQSEAGYRSSASYGLYSVAIDYFRDKVALMNLGGSAGHSESERDGLGAFKKGWANATRTAYLCGRILDEVSFRELCQLHPGRGDFFPPYRS